MTDESSDDLQALAAMLRALTDKELVDQYLHLEVEDPAIDAYAREMEKRNVDF